MPSTNKQITDQLAKLSLVFEPPMPRTVGNDPNPRYAALVEVYVASLQPFQPWELEAGVKLALESHKYAKWPKPAELRAFCLEAQRSAGPPAPAGPPRYLLAKPERREVTPAERELVNMKIQVRQEWERSGKYTACDRDKSGRVIRWHYSAADCAREARRRLAGQERAA